MPYLTLTENVKLQLSPGLVPSYDIQPGNGVGLFWDKHTHVYSLAYLPRTVRGPTSVCCTQLLRRLCTTSLWRLFFAGKLSWDITTTQVNSALHPSGVAKSSTSFGWSKDGKVTSAGWQVTLCDLIWHVISGSGVVISITNCYIRFTLVYLAQFYHACTTQVSGTKRYTDNVEELSYRLRWWSFPNDLYTVRA